jgi:hypothetical protein
MKVVEVGAAVTVIRTALHLRDNTVHGCLHALHILANKFRKGSCRFCKLVGRCLHLYGVLVRYCHEQVEFVGEIIYYPCLYDSAGFRQRADTCFLVVHPQKHLECLVYYFFSVGNHIGLSSFMFLFAKIRFLS